MENIQDSHEFSEIKWIVILSRDGKSPFLRWVTLADREFPFYVICLCSSFEFYSVIKLRCAQVPIFAKSCQVLVPQSLPLQLSSYRLWAFYSHPNCLFFGLQVLSATTTFTSVLWRHLLPSANSPWINQYCEDTEIGGRENKRTWV